MTSIQIMLYVVGAMSVIAFVWATLDARRQKTKHRNSPPGASPEKPDLSPPEPIA